MKKELSMLEEQLVDEYYRGKRHIEIYKEHILSYPKGCLSIKNIRGRKTYYLQWREQGKVKSKYVNYKYVDEITKQIEMRRHDEENIRRLKKDIKKIERFLGKELLEIHADEYRRSI